MTPGAPQGLTVLLRGHICQVRLDPTRPTQSGVWGPQGLAGARSGGTRRPRRRAPLWRCRPWRVAPGRPVRQRGRQWVSVAHRGAGPCPACGTVPGVQPSELRMAEPWVPTILSHSAADFWLGSHSRDVSPEPEPPSLWHWCSARCWPLLSAPGMGGRSGTWWWADSRWSAGSAPRPRTSCCLQVPTPHGRALRMLLGAVMGLARAPRRLGRRSRAQSMLDGESAASTGPVSPAVAYKPCAPPGRPCPVALATCHSLTPDYPPPPPRYPARASVFYFASGLPCPLPGTPLPSSLPGVEL